MNNQDELQKSDAYPHKWVEQVRLDDGLEVLIRPIRPEDAKGLKEGFKYLSPESVYRRFLRPISNVTDDEARNLATLDYQTQMAFVACLVEDSKEIVIGVARYAALHSDRLGTVEFAIVVGDDFQERGLGSLLLDRLIRYGRAHGVTTILATVHSTNKPIMHFIDQSDFPLERKMLEPGIWEVRMRI